METDKNNKKRMKDKSWVVIFTFTFSLKSFIQREKIKTKTDKN